MTLSDLDHAISTLENSATADAVSETLEFLRGLRERAVEGGTPERVSQHGSAVKFYPWDNHGMVDALLITPEDG